jgi:hypothetical protein
MQISASIDLMAAAGIDNSAGSTYGRSADSRIVITPSRIVSSWLRLAFSRLSTTDRPLLAMTDQTGHVAAAGMDAGSVSPVVSMGTWVPPSQILAPMSVRARMELWNRRAQTLGLEGRVSRVGLCTRCSDGACTP